MSISRTAPEHCASPLHTCTLSLSTGTHGTRARETPRVCLSIPRAPDATVLSPSQHTASHRPLITQARRIVGTRSRQVAKARSLALVAAVLRATFQARIPGHRARHAGMFDRVRAPRAYLPSKARREQESRRAARPRPLSRAARSMAGIRPMCPPPLRPGSERASLATCTRWHTADHAGPVPSVRPCGATFWLISLPSLRRRRFSRPHNRACAPAHIPALQGTPRAGSTPRLSVPAELAR